MVLAALRAADKQYGTKVVLDGVHLEVRAGSRIALVGRNGSGKTTVLRLLGGEETPDAGEAWRRDDVVVGHLEQAPTFPAGASVRDVADVAFADLDAMEDDLGRLEHAGLDDPATYARWEALHARFERRGGYQRRARRDMVLAALGFTGREAEPVDGFSGGERTRLGLARLLMRAPDVLLLDEPTNHLDVAMRRWLEGWLARYRGAALVVSHDRAFLDGACDVTADVRRGRIETYDGPPSAARAAREERERLEARTRANQRKEEARLEAMTERMHGWAGQNAKLMRRAKAMEKRLERHRDGMLADAERGERTVGFGFDAHDGGHLVVHARHLAKRFDGRPLFEDVDLLLRAGDRVALTGPNGAGKTTLLRVLLGELASDDPRADVRWGARVRVGYYDQSLAGVDPESTLIEELARMVGEREAHDLLGRFLFPYEAQFKTVANLSGGERARLALAKLSRSPYDLLVLDEPTNHLDVEMIETLEAALDAYPGALVVVSHDRRFAARLATQVWEVADGRFEAYEGDWAFFERKRSERRPAAAPGPTDPTDRGPRDAAPAQDAPAPPRDATEAETTDEPGSAADGEALDPRFAALSAWKLERELERLQGEIDAGERDLADLADALAAPDPEAGTDLAELGRRHADAEARLLGAMADWEAAQHALDAKRRKAPSRAR